ncbi:DNA-binding LacI/PurR family transcriptional regulator [Nocardiopsis arvandica]|uniref:DNA-binding LacI/PurR family transcriptional regulator n=1 Tax=Nocardiopsis sinuspersici TaxID=501010 RepID=A0A7Z0BM48_9ACTN|nr:LacI family DNA-binding transcriptional regulator [Nocardiopsis sinuspersici]NYH54212.1 DNA-binding LacI/PurR family transcriptional regulator [Nocardiopsis sinuspersici]
MNPPGGRTPVMADVARLAGVSHQTVSRVVNGHPNVREETVLRVRRAIDELGYHRNSTARALVTRRTNVLGVIAFDTTLFGPAQTLSGIERAAREAGYFLSMVSLDDVSPDGIVAAAEYLIQQSVEGCVAIAPQRSLVDALAALPGPHPLVAVEGGEGSGLPVVCVDQVQGAHDAVRHLLELGHATVHHIEGDPLWLESEARVVGWRRALEEADVPVPEPLPGDWSPRSGYELGRSLVARRAAGERVTAIFVGNDQMAIGVLRALHEAGLRVPGDVSVVGFDDVPEAEYLTPSLTTVFQDFAQVGKESLALLLGEIGTERNGSSGSSGTARRVVPARLRVRGSSGPPPP